VEEQEDLSWPVGDSNCNLGSLSVDEVSLTLVYHVLIFSLAVLFLWANATMFINK